MTFILRGELYKVQPKVMELMLLLLQHQNEVLTRDKIIDCIWVETYATDDTLNNIVGKLRKVLSHDPMAEHAIETIPKVGYRLHSLNDRGSNIGKLTISLVALLILCGFVLFQWTQSSSFHWPNEAKVKGVTTSEKMEVFPDVSSSGKMLAFVRVEPGMQANSLVVRNLENGTEQVHKQTGTLFGNPIWSNDDSVLAYVETRGEQCIVKIRSIESALSRSLGDCSHLLLRTLRPSLAWTQTGHLIVPKQLSERQQVGLVKLNIEKTTTEIVTPDNAQIIGFANPAESPDGRLLAFTGTNAAGLDSLFISDSNGTNAQEFSDLQGSILGVSWINQQTVILSADFNGVSELWLFDVESGTFTSAPLSGRKYIHPKVNSKDNSLFFADTYSNANISIKRINQQGVVSSTIDFPTSKWERTAKLSPNGDLLAIIRVQDNAAQLWLVNINSKAETKLYENQSGFINSVSWDSSGQHLIFDAVANGQSKLFTFNLMLKALSPIATELSGSLHNPVWKGENQFLFSRFHENGWQIWQGDISGNLKLKAKQGGNKVGVSETGDIYFSRLNEAGLWVLKSDTSLPYQLDTGIKRLFQHWLIKGSKIYYIGQKAGPSTQILVYDLSSREDGVFYSNENSFNFFDLQDDQLMVAEITTFGGDIFSVSL